MYVMGCRLCPQSSGNFLFDGHVGVEMETFFFPAEALLSFLTCFERDAAPTLARPSHTRTECIVVCTESQAVPFRLYLQEAFKGKIQADLVVVSSDSGSAEAMYEVYESGLITVACCCTAFVLCVLVMGWWDEAAHPKRGTSHSAPSWS